MTFCIHAYLLYLVGYTIFIDKSDNYFDAVFIKYFRDLTTIHQWSYGVSTLAFPYYYLTETTIFHRI